MKPFWALTFISWWTLVTSGHTASTTTPPLARACATTSGAEPWALSINGEPVGTSATSFTKMTPRSLKWLTTWALWTISWKQ